ncbi:glycosyltransferase family 2 protein [Lysinibacillus pakistanensis]|uniref:glycosyltransferase family 2 protein n=1 Tax=Lysinibacillus pakistanensis TaxID=759811 RepID=UPI003D2C3F08
MEDKNKYLSICIPTYNRYFYLIQNLNIMIKYFEKYNIEIIISDNNPIRNDVFLKYINELKEEYPYIKYHRNEVNIGADINMIQVLSMSESEYSLWLGDDDILDDNFFDRFFSIELEKDYDFILLNDSSIDENLIIKGKDFRRSKDIVYHNLIDLFKNHVSDMPFGSLIVKNKYLQEVNLKKYFGTYHAYSGYVWEYLNLIDDSREINVLVSNHLKVYSINCSKTWSNRSFQIYYFNIPQWFLSLPSKIEKISKLTLEEYLTEIYSNSFLINNIKYIDELKNVPYKLSEVHRKNLNLVQSIRNKYYLHS